MRLDLGVLDLGLKLGLVLGSPTQGVSLKMTNMLGLLKKPKAFNPSRTSPKARPISSCNLMSWLFHALRRVNITTPIGQATHPQIVGTCWVIERSLPNG
jgi:hypothetical protein